MKIKVLLKYLFVSALVVLGAGMQEAMASKGRIINANGAGTTEFTFGKWQGSQNGMGVIVEIWPTAPCTGSQGAVPNSGITPELVSNAVREIEAKLERDIQAGKKARNLEQVTAGINALTTLKSDTAYVNGVPTNTGAVIFNDSNGTRTWSIAQSNFLLWEGPTGNGWPVLQATLLAGQPLTTCFPSVAAPVTTTLSFHSDLGTQVVPATQVRPGNFNVSGGNKTTLATNVLATSNGQSVSCSTPPPVQTFRAVVIGSPTLELGLKQNTVIVGTVLSGQYNITAEVAGDFWCTNIGQFILSDDIFSDGFQSALTFQHRPVYLVGRYLLQRLRV